MCTTTSHFRLAGSRRRPVAFGSPLNAFFLTESEQPMHRALAVLPIIGGLLSAAPPGADKPGAIPARYQDIPKSRLAKLVEVWGTTEQEPAFGHTAVFSPAGKLALHVSGGAQPSSGNVDDALLTLWDAGQGHIVSEWRVPKAGVSACAIAPDNKHALLAVVEPDPKKGTEKVALRYRDLGNEKDLHNL